ncbi:MAG: hypothetical protein AAFX80_10715 [Cyanobacteria bacterium J06639_18]
MGLLFTEILVLNSVLPQFQRKDRLQLYKGILQETLIQASITSADTFGFLKELRQKMALNNDEHYRIF